MNQPGRTSRHLPLGEQRFQDLGVLILCLLALLLAFSQRQLAYFRDYSITFEGSYRLFLGQMPYRDFFAPVGPGSFLLPALFFKLFSPNWTVFLYTQQFENALLLLLAYSILKRLGVRPLIRNIALIAHTLFYLLLQTHPWYNSTGALLLFAAARLAMVPRIGAVIMAGLLAGLAVLTKQDFGLLTLLVGGFFIALVAVGSDLGQIVPDVECLRDPARLRLVAAHLLVFALAAISVVGLFILATDPAHFAYWFNYGQAPHERRSVGLKELLGNSFGTLGLLTAMLGLLRNNLRLLAASVFLTAASVSRTTSGLGFTHYYFVAFIPIILDECLRLKIRWKAVLLLIAFYTAGRVMIRPVKDVYHVFESVALHQPEHFFFDHHLISGPLVAMPDSLTAFSPRMLAPQATIDAILRLKGEVARATPHPGAPPLRVLNITELTPIYAELGVPPPTGLPLWFHSKVSLFPEQIRQLKGILAGDSYDFILIQGTHEGLSPTYKELLSILDANPAYVQSQRLAETPSNFTWPCKPDCQGDIYIYARRAGLLSTYSQRAAQ